MNLNCSNTTIKYLMFTFNFMFVITGIILIGVAMGVKSSYDSYDNILDSPYFSLPNLMIATGIIIFLISFLGCYGAMKENWLFLMGFSVLLIVIFIFELSAGIAGYILKGKTSAYLDEELKHSIKSYNSSSASMWDIVQERFQCCGIESFEDWSAALNSKELPISCCPRQIGIIGTFYCNAEPTNRTTVASISSTTVTPTTTTSSSSSSITAPLSTTAKTTTKNGAELITDGLPKSSSHPYSIGCKAAFGSYVKSHVIDIGAVGFALAIIQIFGIAFSFHLARQLKNGYYST